MISPLTSRPEAVRNSQNGTKELHMPVLSRWQPGDLSTTSSIYAIVNLAGVAMTTRPRGASVSYGEQCWSLEDVGAR